MGRKYFFFDIDGTLLVGPPGRQYMPESAKLALKKLRGAGHFVAIATGRGHMMAVDLMAELDIHNAVTDGGNGIVVNDEVKKLEPMDYERCMALIDELKEKDFIWSFCPEDSRVRTAPDERFGNVTGDVYMKNVVIPDLDHKKYKNIYKIFIACEPGREKELAALSDLEWCRYQEEYLFVEPDDKAHGIDLMEDLLGIEDGDVVVFGDSKNDLSMFNGRWLSVAMGNAPDFLKEKATFVTTDAGDDGIFNACRHFKWI